ncbi:MAG: hypothetical protein CVT49_05965 [candidate division Zixibacteria bacterium HGW-Zixibacteria-1]|nr:MAG: hypothetical protein CVT49_05965 [candidate division Zixibacteria bacterium HGW-Zixibacteria-1]
MSKSVKIIVIFTAALLIMLAAVQVYGDEVTKKFEAKKRVTVNTVSGDCIVEKSETNEITATFIQHTRPDGAMKPKFTESSSVLELEEIIRGSSSGDSRWIVRVPEGTKIEFTTASGSFSVEDMTGDFKVNTASGNIDITNCSGVFDINTASGDIDASGITIEDDAVFGTASGTVRVDLAETPEYDIRVGSASGKAILMYNGHEIKGNFEFSYRPGKGHIECPYDFDDEEEYYNGDQVYIRKSFVRGSDVPFVHIGTASGRAVLKK